LSSPFEQDAKLMPFSPQKLFGTVATVSALTLAVFTTAWSGASFAAPVSCGPNNSSCSFNVFIDDFSSPLGRNVFSVVNGTFQLTHPSSFIYRNPEVPGDVANITIESLSGNADPFLLVNHSASTGLVGHTFTISVEAPLDVSGPVTADSTVSYSLTAAPGVTGSIKAADRFHKILSGTDVDANGPLPALDKGIDAGEDFSFSNTDNIPQTQNSAVFTAHSSLNVDPGYDTMTATLHYSLAPFTSVGISGGISQLPVPEAPTYALLVAGLGLVGFAARRRLRS
jgi:hypothetical protein